MPGRMSRVLHRECPVGVLGSLGCVCHTRVSDPSRRPRSRWVPPLGWGPLAPSPWHRVAPCPCPRSHGCHPSRDCPCSPRAPPAIPRASPFPIPKVIPPSRDPFPPQRIPLSRSHGCHPPRDAAPRPCSPPGAPFPFPEHPPLPCPWMEQRGGPGGGMWAGRGALQRRWSSGGLPEGTGRCSPAERGRDGWRAGEPGDAG